jgi:hypothetical protein
MRKSLLQQLLLLIFFGASTSGSSQETKPDLAEEFKKYDISGNGYLSGTEITACNCKHFDFDGDGIVMDTEFFKGRGGKPPVKAPEGFVAGTIVEIEYGGRWYPGHIMEVKGEQYKIHYTGYGDNWDSWVTKDKLRIKGRGTTDTETPRQNSTSTQVERAGNNGNAAACNFEPPAPEYVQSAPFSIALAKRNLYNKYLWKANGTTMAPKRVGVTYLSFQALSPYKNNVIVHPARGAERLNSAAPPNVMIYPVRSRHVVCEEYSTGTTRYQVESDYDCFKDRDGEWVCGSSGNLPPKITQLD